MAGGSGKRFWPLSRSKNPKQLLNLSGRMPLVCEAFEHLRSTILPENIFIVTNIKYRKKIIKAFNYKFPPNNIICEPASRNTSACILYALLKIKHMFGDGTIVIMPADLYIGEDKLFHEDLLKALNRLEYTKDIITFGILPTFPATGYGYIKYVNSRQEVKKVEKFIEKPKYEEALRYYKSGEYFWNSGIFVSNIFSLIGEYENFLPSMYKQFFKIDKYINSRKEYSHLSKIYPFLEIIPIDKGIIEKSLNVKMIVASFTWDDVGSWEKLKTYHLEDEFGNLFLSNNLHVDTKNVITYSKDMMIITLGVKDIVVAEYDRAILVCHKSRTQEVGELVEKITEKKYL